MNQQSEDLRMHVRRSIIQRGVAEEFYDINPGSAEGIASHHKEAMHLREAARLIEERLRELGAILADTRETWSDGEYEYRSSTVTKETLTVDQDVLKAVDAVLYERVTKRILDTARLRTMISEGRLGSSWTKYATFKKSAPYVVVKKEAISEKEIRMAFGEPEANATDEEVQA